jgi:hypothetical protein
MTKPDIVLMLDSARGRYIPRDFAEIVDRKSVSNVLNIHWAILKAGPDHEHYWDIWQDVEQNAVVTIDDVRYRLHQDGDLWLVPDGMEWSDSEDCFVWP